MKKTFLLITVCLIFSSAIAQNRANTWYFGYGAGLDFNSGIPVPLLDGQLSTREGCATISDNNGDLLFYTDGMTVYNRSHGIMQNGTGLNGHPSSTHSAIIVPVVGSWDSYYIFTVDEGLGTKGLQYSVVDMALDGGLGAITVKNVVLGRVTEKVGSFKKTFSDDFWVVTQKYNSNDFLAYNISASGVDPVPVVSSVGAVNTPARRQAGQIKFSLDGKRLAISNGWETQVFDFDEATGRVTNPITLLRNVNSYGIEFSPSGNILYVACYQRVYQLDLSAGTEVDIENSKIILKTSYDESFGSLQLGRDGKIYGVKVRKGYLDVIHDPDNMGLTCNYSYDDLYLGGKQGFLGLPTFISNIRSLTGSIGSENTCLGDTTNFTFQTQEALTAILWDFGDGSTSTSENPAHAYAASGTYLVRVTATSASGTTMETKEITIYDAPAANSVADIEVCNALPNYQFYLTTKNVEVLGAQSAANYQIHYFAKLEDAENNTDPLSESFTISSFRETLFARIQNVDNISCHDITSFDVIVKQAPIPNAVQDWAVCDSDSDGFFTIDLRLKDDEILNGQNAGTFKVAYFETQTYADSGTNPIGPNYTNTASLEQIFFRIENTASPECYETGTFDLEVITAVQANDPPDVEVCDDNNDGISTFDLGKKNSEVLGTQNPVNFTVSYHANQDDADSGSNAVMKTGYSNAVPYMETIYARVENKADANCFDTVSFSLRVFDSPVLQSVENWQVCDHDDDGIYSFDLTQRNPKILGGQSTSQFTVSYHGTEVDAVSGQNALIGNYENTTNPQTVFYRIQNNSSSICFLTDSFELEVFGTPVANGPTEIFVCDTDETGIQTLDLSTKDIEILNGHDPNTYSISYFRDQTDADLNRNALAKTSYNNTELEETIYARIQNLGNENCYDTTSFNLIVNRLPRPQLEEIYVICPDSPELTIDGGDFETWSWRDSDGQEVSGARRINATDLGEYSLTVSQRMNGAVCEKTVFFEVVPSGAPEDFTTEIGNPSDKVTITVNANGTGEFEYSTDGENFQDSNLLEVFPGLHTVYVRDKFLCRTIGKEVIALGYPKFFTPNNDGIHERWNIIGAAHYPESELYIYDRYGKLLDRCSPMGPGWDGTYNGTLLPSSDYWFRYVFAEGKDFTGHFSLKR